jgi:hypothetical protein
VREGRTPCPPSRRLARERNWPVLGFEQLRIRIYGPMRTKGPASASKAELALFERFPWSR